MHVWRVGTRQRQRLSPQAFERLERGLARRAVVPHRREFAQRLEEGRREQQHEQALAQAHSLDVVAGMVGATHRHTPNAKNAALYRQLLPVYLSLPRKLGEEYRLLAAFQQQTAAPPPPRRG